MSNPERQEVHSIAEYLRDTITEMDGALGEMRVRRDGLAMRLAVIDAATSPDVQEAIEDYERRVAENRPYEDAEDAEKVLSEAHRRFVK